MTGSDFIDWEAAIALFLVILFLLKVNLEMWLS